MTDRKTKFSLTFPENLVKDVNLTPTDPLSYDDLGKFVPEQNRLQRIVEANTETVLKVDYSNFSNHVFFDSAVSKFNIAKSRILKQYPYNGNTDEKDLYYISSSGYERYIFDQWPVSVGYVNFDGIDQYISASDGIKVTVPNSSSLLVSAWINTVVPVTSTCPIVWNMNIPDINNVPFSNGYAFQLTRDTDDTWLVFAVNSGSDSFFLSCSYSAYTGSWNHVVAQYNVNAQQISLFVNSQKQCDISCILGPIEQETSIVFAGACGYTSASAGYIFDLGCGGIYFSGSIDEINIYNTASQDLITSLYNRAPNTPYQDYLDYSHDNQTLYWKFNEGIVGDPIVDSLVVDYSNNNLHGTYVNYSAGSRVSGSVTNKEDGDPILYSFHPDVVSFSSSLILSATQYDAFNNNLIFNLIPQSLVQEDQNSEGLLSAFALSMARFFDEIKLYIDQFENIKTTNYQDINCVPDLFLPYLMKYFGFMTTNHYGYADPSEFFLGSGVIPDQNLEISLFEIRNQFWRRTLNNMPYLVQSKGKRACLDAYFNILGINKENIDLKEYGYLPGGSIGDTRITADKATSFLGFGIEPVSTTSSFVQVTSSIPLNPSFCVEVLAQLPYAGAEYATSLINDGHIWTLSGTSSSLSLAWSSALADSGGVVSLTCSDGSCVSASFPVFDGRFCNIVAGVDSTAKPFIQIESLDNDTISFNSSTLGTVALIVGDFTGSHNSFFLGSNDFMPNAKAQGYFGELRVWNRALSSLEVDSHTLHFENIGLTDPSELPNPLILHWMLTENFSADSNGMFSYVNNNAIKDNSRNRRLGTGKNFGINQNPYNDYYLSYNYLSPSVDLKWTQNKIRVRNKTELTLADIATDTNEVALEFNLIDALNEDITKIFSTMDSFNNAIGNPVNKYRDEYADLESYRRIYFDRLTDSLNFTNFFNLFRWFDTKVSDSIKQLLPARVNFIGGEHVIESHYLERPRYAYKYPIFRTPKDIPNAEISGVFAVNSSEMNYFETPTAVMGTYGATQYKNNSKYGEVGPFVKTKDTTVYIEADKSPEFVTTYTDGEDYFNFKESIRVPQYSQCFFMSASGSPLDVIIWDMAEKDNFAVMVGSSGGLDCVLGNNQILNPSSPFVILSSSTHNILSVDIDSNGAIYVGVTAPWAIYKSHITASNSWNLVDYQGSLADLGKVRVDFQDNVYAVGTDDFYGQNTTIRKSKDKGQTWQTVDLYTGNLARVHDICFSNNGNVFVLLDTSTIRTSFNGEAGSWYTLIDNGFFSSISIDNINGNIYVISGSGVLKYDNNFNLIYITGSGFSSNASLDFVKSRYATLSCINGNKLYVQQNGKDQITAGFYRSTYNASDPGNLSLTLIYDFSYLLGADQEPLFVRSSKTLNDRIFIGFNDGNNYNISVVMYNPYSLQLDKKFNKIKVSGDQKNDTSNSECCINSKNEFARRLLDAKERDNK